MIATGTPAGVGYPRKPPIFMKPGDEIVIEIDGHRAAGESSHRGRHDPMRVWRSAKKAVKLRAVLRNAAFSFDEMTTSRRARGGQMWCAAAGPVIGYAFNSTGRYACGAQMRDRFIPRLLRDEGLTLDPSAFDPDRGGSRPMMRSARSQAGTWRSVAIAHAGTCGCGMRWARSRTTARCGPHRPSLPGRRRAAAGVLLCGRRLVRARQDHPRSAGGGPHLSRHGLHPHQGEGRRAPLARSTSRGLEAVIGCWTTRRASRLTRIAGIPSALPPAYAAGAQIPGPALV